MSLDISLIADKLNEDAKRKEHAQNQDQAPDMNQWIRDTPEKDNQQRETAENSSVPSNVHSSQSERDDNESIDLIRDQQQVQTQGNVSQDEQQRNEREQGYLSEPPLQHLPGSIPLNFDDSGSEQSDPQLIGTERSFHRNSRSRQNLTDLDSGSDGGNIVHSGILSDIDRLKGYESFRSSSEETELSKFFTLASTIEKEEEEPLTENFRYRSSMEKIVGENADTFSVHSVDTSSMNATLSALDAPKTRQPNTEEVMKECKRLLSSFEQRTHDDVLDSRDHVQVSRAKEDIIHRIQEFIRAVNDCEYELELITKKKRKLEVPCKTTNEYIAKLREENEELRQKYQIAKTELENHEDEYLQLCQAEDNFIALCLDLNRKIDQKNAREDKAAHEMRLLSEAEDYKRKMFMYISRHYHIEPTEESAIGLLNKMLHDATKKILTTVETKNYEPNEWFEFNPELFSETSGNGKVLRTLELARIIKRNGNRVKLEDPFPNYSLN